MEASTYNYIDFATEKLVVDVQYDQTGHERVNGLDDLVVRIEEFVKTVKLGEVKRLVCIFPDDIKPDTKRPAVVLQFDARNSFLSNEFEERKTVPFKDHEFLIVNGEFGQGQLTTDVTGDGKDLAFSNCAKVGRTTSDSQILDWSLFNPKSGGVVMFKLGVPLTEDPSASSDLSKFEIKVGEIAYERFQVLEAEMMATSRANKTLAAGIAAVFVGLYTAL